MDANGPQTSNERHLIFKDEVYAIVGAAIEVSNELGSGFLEAVYQEAMSIELSDRGIPHVQQQHLPVAYKSRLLRKAYIADFVCFDQVIVEIKAIRQVTTAEEAEVLNCLKASRLPVGILLNFGSPRLQWRRYARTQDLIVHSRSPSTQ